MTSQIILKRTPEHRLYCDVVMNILVSKVSMEKRGEMLIRRNADKEMKVDKERR